MKKHLCIAMCASASFFKELLEVGRKLETLGYSVLYPDASWVMEKNDFKISSVKTWLKDDEDYFKKTELIREHFKKIEQCDAILVINLTKNGILGYIGGATIMEMGLALYLNKKIFILNLPDKKLSLYEEVMALGATFLDGDLSKI